MSLLQKRWLLVFVCMVFACGCRGRNNGTLPETGDTPATLEQCPESPNCVFSQAKDPDHSIAPFLIKGDIGRGWEILRKEIAAWPRTTLVQTSPTYLHAECRSMIFRFVDDVECLLDAVTGEVNIRSAARVGYSDFGVNRQRVKMLRTKLKACNCIQ